MKKIILGVLVTILITSTLTGCGSNSTSKETTTQTQEPTSTTSLNSENQEVIEKDKPTYYSCLSEVDNHLELNITVQEFLNNYNSLKSSYEDKSYNKLEMSDFFFIEKNTDKYGDTIETYGCSQTIFGTFNDLIISLNVNGEKIHSVAFGIKNNKYIDMYYKEPYYTKIMKNYELLISSLTGCSMNESENCVNKLIDNGKYAYVKGLLFSHDTSNQMADWLRIIPCTEEEYKTGISK